MLGRCFRSFSKFDTRGLNIHSERYQPDLDRTLSQLLNPDNFTAERAFKVVRGYYFAFNAAKEEKRRMNWDEEPSIIQSAKELVPLVHTFSPDNLIMLIKNAALVQIKDEALWEEIEKSYLDNGLKGTSAANIGSIAMSFSKSYRKNNILWTAIEELIMGELYPNGQLEGRTATDVLKAFGLVQKGSEMLYTKLVENIISKIETCSIQDIIKVLQVHSKLMTIDPEFLNLLLTRLMSLNGEFNCYNLSIVLTNCLQLKASPKSIEFFEKEFTSRSNQCSLFDLSSLAAAYGRFAFTEGVENKSGVEFLKNIEIMYGKKRASFAGANGLSLSDSFKEVKIFWAFAKADVCTDTELWKKFLASKEKIVGDTKSPYVQQYLTEIDEYVKEKNLA